MDRDHFGDTRWTRWSDSELLRLRTSFPASTSWRSGFWKGNGLGGWGTMWCVCWMFVVGGSVPGFKSSKWIPWKERIFEIFFAMLNQWPRFWFQATLELLDLLLLLPAGKSKARKRPVFLNDRGGRLKQDGYKTIHVQAPSCQGFMTAALQLHARTAVKKVPFKIQLAKTFWKKRWKTWWVRGCFFRWSPLKSLAMAGKLAACCQEDENSNRHPWVLLRSHRGRENPKSKLSRAWTSEVKASSFALFFSMFFPPKVVFFSVSAAALRQIESQWVTWQVQDSGTLQKQPEHGAPQNLQSSPNELMGAKRSCLFGQSQSCMKRCLYKWSKTLSGKSQTTSLTFSIFSFPMTSYDFLISARSGRWEFVHRNGVQIHGLFLQGCGWVFASAAPWSLVWWISWDLRMSPRNCSKSRTRLRFLRFSLKAAPNFNWGFSIKCWRVSLPLLPEGFFKEEIFASSLSRMIRTITVDHKTEVKKLCRKCLSKGCPVQSSHLSEWLCPSSSSFVE